MNIKKYICVWCDNCKTKNESREGSSQEWMEGSNKAKWFYKTMYKLCCIAIHPYLEVQGTICVYVLKDRHGSEARPVLYLNLTYQDTRIHLNLRILDTFYWHSTLEAERSPENLNCSCVHLVLNWCGWNFSSGEFSVVDKIIFSLTITVVELIVSNSLSLTQLYSVNPSRATSKQR